MRVPLASTAKWVLAVTVCVLTTTRATETQGFSAAEQEVWQEEVKYWDSRTPGKLDEHMALWHENVIAWGSTLQKPGAKADIRDNVAGVLRDTRPGSHAAHLDPLVVRINGDFAFVFYRANEVRTDLSGKRRESRFRVTHTWWRTPSGWKIIAGMGATDSN